jgi:hypothetical protein
VCSKHFLLQQTQSIKCFATFWLIEFFILLNKPIHLLPN